MMSPQIDLIANQLGKATRTRGGWLCLCPAHDDHKPSLSLSVSEEGTLLAHCYAGCSFTDVMSTLRSRGLLEKSDFLERRDMFQVPQSPKEPHKVALRIWLESVRAEGTYVETYLRSRGIQGPIPPTLRFHPRLFHTSRTYHPAMVAAVTLWPSKTVAGVHRTYLTADGTDKATLSPNKMMLGLIKGGAVKLSPIGTKLILAEGIETALSCFYATSIPTWSCLSTSGMMDVVVPPLEITQEIIICADGDDAGQHAASKLAERLHRTGYGVHMAPSTQGQEWLEPHLKGINLLILDNLSSLCRSGRENESESWNPLQGWLLKLRKAGIFVLFVHHAGKGGNQRGTSKKEDILDTVIVLRKPNDYDPKEWARFEVHYEKARGFYGDEASPFEAWLNGDHGTMTWQVQEIEDVH